MAPTGNFEVAPYVKRDFGTGGRTRTVTLLRASVLNRRVYQFHHTRKSDGAKSCPGERAIMATAGQSSIPDKAGQALTRWGNHST